MKIQFTLQNKTVLTQTKVLKILPTQISIDILEKSESD